MRRAEKVGFDFVDLVQGDLIFVGKPFQGVKIITVVGFFGKLGVSQGIKQNGLNIVIGDNVFNVIDIIFLKALILGREEFVAHSGFAVVGFRKPIGVCIFRAFVIINVKAKCK